jgi:hypothetical protein
MDHVSPANSLKDEIPPIPGLTEAERRKAAVLIQVGKAIAPYSTHLLTKRLENL